VSPSSGELSLKKASGLNETSITDTMPPLHGRGYLQPAPALFTKRSLRSGNPTRVRKRRQANAERAPFRAALHADGQMLTRDNVRGTATIWCFII
jgi:hypothetical protein